MAVEKLSVDAKMLSHVLSKGKLIICDCSKIRLKL